jgi:hypothetical protein
MRFSKTMGVVVLVIAALSLVLVPKSSASIFEERTLLTFNQPVEIPGQILPPGSYVFKVVDNIMQNRNLIMVTNADETNSYGIFMTVPACLDACIKTTLDKPIVKWAERPAGQPQAIAAWWYPGWNYPTPNEDKPRFIAGYGSDGHAFIYPKRKVVAMAAVPPAPQPAPVAPPAPVAEAAVVPQPAPEPAAEPTPAPVVEEQTRVAQNEQQAAPEQAPPEQAAPEQQATLPKTASSLPLVGLMGLMSLAAAFALFIVTRRAS